MVWVCLLISFLHPLPPLRRSQDVVPPKEYTAWCSKLLVQYKAAFKLVQCEECPSVEAFVKKYKVNGHA